MRNIMFSCKYAESLIEKKWLCIKFCRPGRLQTSSPITKGLLQEAIKTKLLKASANKVSRKSTLPRLNVFKNNLLASPILKHNLNHRKKSSALLKMQC